ncbi:MAG: hypothetical protein AB8G16_19580 [Gammaproteobacteria bacterium]
MISDEQLTLYFYADELGDEEMRQIERALGDDAALAARYAALCADLDRLGADLVVPAAPAEFVTSLHDALIEAAAPATVPRKPVWQAAALAATVCLVAVLAVFALRPSTVEVGDTPAAVVVPAEPQDSATVVASIRSVQSHLVASRLQLVSFEAASSTERSALLLELLARNRVAAQRADENGHEDLGRVLRAMQLLLGALAEMVSDGGELDPALLAQIEFELNAMLTKLDALPSNSTISF